MHQHTLYEPLGIPKRIADRVWLIDGPEIGMAFGPATMPFPTRMVVVQLADDSLWLHSPIQPSPELFAQIDAIGPVSHLVAPNGLHYWFMADWIERYPRAATYSVGELQHKAKRPFRIDHVLAEGASFDWCDEIDWLLFEGTVVSEAVFHLRASSVLILTDLIENFEADRVRSGWLRLLMRFAGIMHPGGGTPRDYWLTFWPKRKAFRVKAQRMLAWKPSSVVMAHGKPYLSDDEAKGAVQVAERFGRFYLK